MVLNWILVNFKGIRNKYKMHAFAAILFLAILLVFGSGIKPILVVTAFIILAAFSTFYHNYIRMPINFELVKFLTIIGSVSHGVIAGILIGVFSVVLGRALSGRFDQDLVTSLAATVIIAVLAGIFRSADIVVLGIVLVIVYYILILPFILLFKENRIYAVVYVGSNLIFNSILFINLGPFLLGLVS